MVVAAGVVETVVTGAAEVAGATGIAVSVGATTGAAGTSGAIGVEFAANSAACEFKAKLDMIARNADDEIVAVAIRARRAGCGLRVINLVIFLVISLIFAIFIFAI
ncbi:unannotated protein [freshwater metagenome]|uniref:Unannotated protein n=1 Tax=freshwater metagenome TaxID=449393 RepID=A0A6J6TBZ6_9ZZZZ